MLQKNTWVRVWSFFVSASLGASAVAGLAPYPSANIHPQTLQDYVSGEVSGNLAEAFNGGFETVCRRYSSLSKRKKKEVIGAFVTAVAKAESGLDSFSKYRESFGVWSLGLFQTSYEDQAAYGCPYDRTRDSGKSPAEKTVFRTENQVACFMQVATKLFAQPGNYAYLRQLAARRRIAPGSLTPMEKLSAYWSIFRPSNASGNRRFRDGLNNYLPGYCR